MPAATILPVMTILSVAVVVAASGRFSVVVMPTPMALRVMMVLSGIVMAAVVTLASVSRQRGANCDQKGGHKNWKCLHRLVGSSAPT